MWRRRHTMKSTSTRPRGDAEAPRDVPPLTIVQQVKDWTAVAGSQTGNGFWQDARVIVKGGRVMNWKGRSNKADRECSGWQRQGET